MPAYFLVPLGAGQDRLADGAGTDELEDEFLLRVRALLEAGLEKALFRGLGAQGDGAGVFDGVGQRRLAIDMLAGLERVQDDVLVFMGGVAMTTAGMSWLPRMVL